MQADDHYDAHLGRLPRRRQPRDVPGVPRPGVPRRVRRVARPLQEPVPGPARATCAPATGTTSAASASRRPTASSPRWSSRTPCRRSSRPARSSPGRPTPDEYEHRLAGIRAHNRWLVDWCAAYPERRAGDRPDLPQRRRRRASPTCASPPSTGCAAASCCRPSPTTPSTSSRSTRPTTTRCGRRARSSASW